MFLVLVLPLLLAPFSGAASAFTMTGDTPYVEGGDGFMSGDDCGFVMGTASSYSSLRGSTTVAFTSVEPDRDQGCIDASGYAYSSSSRESYANFTAGTPISTTVTMDMDWSTTAANNVVVDQSTGYWGGYARILDSSITPASSRLVSFDWTCAPSSSCYGLDTGKYHVTTNLSTGAVTGYAWSDYYGFISFNSLTEELAPRQIETVITILDSDGNEPDTVDYTNAPLADGYDYWRVRVQFFNRVTGLPLPESDITSLYLDVAQTADTNVFLNQVEKDGDAIDETPENVYLGCTGVTDYCLQTEDDGSDSFNTYIFSGSPTSNVLADYSDTPGVFYSDRDGCRWIYEDQWSEVDGRGAQPKCELGTGSYMVKADYFYARQDAFNKYEIDYITLRVSFADTSTSGPQDLEMYTWDDSATGGSAFSAGSSASGTYYGYWPASGFTDLSFRPRYQITKFVGYYDEGEHTDITEDPVKVMSLRTEATLYDTSEEYQGTYGGNDRPGFTVTYQLDAETTGDAGATTNTYLLIDTDTPPNDPSSQDVEETHRENSIATDYTNTTYSRDYAMGYGQKASYLATCGGLVSCVTPTNVLSSPTAEQWVCDAAGDKRNNDDSCYYTDYLPRVDRHVEPQDMLVIGAINSVIDATDLLDENYVSALGTGSLNSRNLMYAQLARYTLGQTAGSGTLDSDMEPTGDIISLMNGRLLFAEGDVTIDGSSAFSNKTLAVKGGDVFIDGDITGGQLGIFVVKSGGVGGDVHLAPSVNNVHANIFIDGSLFSYDGVSAPTGDYPTWYNAGVRLETLLNQFYLNGSFVGRNGVNTADDDTLSSWDKGDGTTTTVYEEAQEHDLNFLRQYRRCYELETDGTLSTTEMDCGEGEVLSEYRDETTGLPVYNSFILEFSPTSDLPLFNMESGLFR